MSSLSQASAGTGGKDQKYSTFEICGQEWSILKSSLNSGLVDVVFGIVKPVHLQK